jgi:hypothetical protein
VIDPNWPPVVRRTLEAIPDIEGRLSTWTPPQLDALASALNALLGVVANENALATAGR